MGAGNGMAEGVVPSAEILTERLAGLDLDELLRAALDAFEPGRLGVLSAFGPGSLVVIHRLYSAGLRVPVFFVDTLHHFSETLELVERVRARYDLDLRIYRHCESRAEFEARYGPELWKRDLDRYQELAKVEPYRRAISDLDGWFTGRRREQSGSRTDLPLIEDGTKLRINPLVDWTRTDVWRLILDNEIPYNPLHDLGYTSIGDEPLTSAVRPGEDERAGRWRGTGRSECGIHVAPLDR